jgi:hypothetical protein
MRARNIALRLLTLTTSMELTKDLHNILFQSNPTCLEESYRVTIQARCLITTSHTFLSSNSLSNQLASTSSIESRKDYPPQVAN